ncbi:MAG: ABC transporter ATP-binding protein [Erysipelothrix sp.]|nr:ABC transporter ATP-binding protein [Erysipelothrix sp.]
MNILEVKNLHTYFDTRRGTIEAVRGITFSLQEGRTLGIVGESGSGKSQTAMSILQLFEPNQYIADGEIWYNGEKLSEFKEEQLMKIRGNDISMIFQEPMTSLNPVFTVENQINEVLILHQNLTEAEASKRSLEMLNAVKIPNAENVLKQYPHQLSGGMSQRVMIAMALACQPKILIADEPTTALDVIIQAEILKLMNDLKNELKTSIIFITHDLGVINEMADDVIVMYGGKIVEQASIKQIFDNPKHPYTKRLLDAYLLTDIITDADLKLLGLKDKRKQNDEVDPFDFTFNETGNVDEDWYEVEPGHFVACRLK